MYKQRTGFQGQAEQLVRQDSGCRRGRCQPPGGRWCHCPLGALDCENEGGFGQGDGAPVWVWGGGRASPGPQTPLKGKEHSYPFPVQREPPSLWAEYWAGLGDSKADRDLSLPRGAHGWGCPRKEGHSLEGSCDVYMETAQSSRQLENQGELPGGG